MLAFDQWVAAARDELRQVSPGLEFRAGEDAALRGYYDADLSPAGAVAELLAYAQSCD